MSGPSLPPGYCSTLGEDEDTIGPSLPSTHSSSASSMGPQQLPPRLNIQSETPKDDTSHVYGPTLPPGFGPSFPPNLSPTHSDSEDSSDGEIIGPMPSAPDSKKDEDNVKRAKVEIEARAQAMKDKLTGKNEPAPLHREEWMTVLPKEFKPLGVGPRKFRTRVPECGDRSVWTDTPEDKHRRAEEAQSGKVTQKSDKGSKERETSEELTYACTAAQEAALAKQVEEYNREYRSETLMNMHRKRRAEERGYGGGVSERHPFDRETDLDAPRSIVTSAKRMALMKDSKKALDSKFQSGSRSFL